MATVTATATTKRVDVDSGHLEEVLETLKLDQARGDGAAGCGCAKGRERDTLLICLADTCQAAVRAGALGLTIRSSMSLLLVLVKIGRIAPDTRLKVLRHALFGDRSMRFGAMLASFVAVYKFVLGTAPVLRRVLAREYLRVTAVLGHVSSRTSSRGRSAAVYSNLELWLLPAIAGALAGAVAITCQRRSERTGISQELLARGMQGVWNTISTRYSVRVPHGDVLVYALSLGQLMYSFNMHPETVTPPSLLPWLDGACQVPARGLKMNRDLIQRGAFDLADAQALMRRKDITPANWDTLSRRISETMGATPLLPADCVVPCAALHPAADTCVGNAPAQFWRVFKWMLPGYLVAHVGPLVALRHRVLLGNPVRETLSALLGAVRTSTMQGVYVLIYIALFCGKNNLYRYLARVRASGGPGDTLLKRAVTSMPRGVPEALVSEQSFWVLGFVASVAFWIEAARRREMFNLYIFPRALGSAWIVARGWGWVPQTGRHGDTIVRRSDLLLARVGVLECSCGLGFSRWPGWR
ncbi:hypothetical protein C8Q80DRAFT_296946 [Daedaleopsis nitida]|nr:hypothetical protein C8Q80DRAFT_296946 [Daedaleopsis nitida]